MLLLIVLVLGVISVTSHHYSNQGRLMIRRKSSPEDRMHIPLSPERGRAIHSVIRMLYNMLAN